MDSNKKVIVAIVVVVLIVGVVIGALAISNNNSTPTPKPEPEPEPTPVPFGDVHYRFENMELMDSCPYLEKNRQILLDELQSGLDVLPGYPKYFMPFNESDYQWVKVNVKIQFENSDVYFCHDLTNPPTFKVHYENGSTSYKFGPTTLRPAYIVNNPESVSSFTGTVELWYLLPEMTNGGGSVIPWNEVTLDDLKISIRSNGKIVPMNLLL